MLGVVSVDVAAVADDDGVEKTEVAMSDVLDVWCPVTEVVLDMIHKYMQ